MSKAFMNTFSIRLNQFIDDTGLNQLKIAKIMKVNRNTVSAWCNNQRNIRIEHLNRFKEFFPDLRFDDIPNIQKKYQQDTFNQNVAENAEVVYNIKNLPPGLKEYRIVITIDFEKIHSNPHTTPI